MAMWSKVSDTKERSHTLVAQLPTFIFFSFLLDHFNETIVLLFVACNSRIIENQSVKNKKQKT